MSSCIDLSSPHEQLCYIPCNFCNIVLAVSVPCSSLFDIVTVRCGHCTNLWSVNMAAGLQSLSLQDIQLKCQAQSFIPQVCKVEMGSSSSSKSNNSSMPVSTTTTANETTPQRVVNRPPEKKHRVPSAYNQFIKEEIQRIKANNPDISHREAFSTAAKNWAHFPHIHFGLMLETKNQAKFGKGPEKCLMTNTTFNN